LSDVGLLPSVVLFATVAFALGLGLTIGAERLSRRLGVVARPVADRWHRREVPLLGGVAIAMATVLPLAASGHMGSRLAVLVLGALAMSMMGLVDDLRPLKPQAKLLAQIVLAVALLNLGFVLPLTQSQFVNVFLTLFWIVGITNAFNLLDNMDGLATTIALVAAGYRLLFFGWDDDVVGARTAAAFLGALAGFLVRNFPPAKIFMGDAGSLFIGSFLAGLSLLDSDRTYSRGVAAVLLLPVLLLLIPIFDTAFVTLTRLLSGRRISVGGRDHTSHRLVAVGLTERQVLLVLAAIAMLSGALAGLSYQVGVSYTAVLVGVLAIALVLLGIFLSRVHVVTSAERPNGGAILRLLADFQYKRQVATLILDVCLIVIAYYAAYVIRFEEAFPDHRPRLYGSLPLLLLTQVVTLAAFGLYRPVWQYLSLGDVVRIVRASTTAVVASIVAFIYVNRFEGLSRTVFILDWVLLTGLLAGSRASFRLFGELFRGQPASFTRVVIYGAGDGGALIVRELLNNPDLRRVPVGFVDDDRDKHQRLIHGVPVLGSGEDIATIVRDRDVEEVIVSSAKINGNGFDRFRDACDQLGVAVRRASLQLE
jgi:UDP-GlcNAc:undecaprenyl-phosphate GlcNAc-1-phosphate transferase